MLKDKCLLRELFLVPHRQSIFRADIGSIGSPSDYLAPQMPSPELRPHIRCVAGHYCWWRSHSSHPQVPHQQGNQAGPKGAPDLTKRLLTCSLCSCLVPSLPPFSTASCCLVKQRCACRRCKLTCLTPDSTGAQQTTLQLIWMEVSSYVRQHCLVRSTLRALWLAMLQAAAI